MWERRLKYACLFIKRQKKNEMKLAASSAAASFLCSYAYYEKCDTFLNIETLKIFPKKVKIKTSKRKLHNKKQNRRLRK